MPGSKRWALSFSRALRPKALLFDLLTALIDSWTLWNSVAGSIQYGRRWRAEYLKITYVEGRYRPYETFVREAAKAVGLSGSFSDRLVERYAELRPWPEVQAVLGSLQGHIVTNCSERLDYAVALPLSEIARPMIRDHCLWPGFLRRNNQPKRG